MPMWARFKEWGKYTREEYYPDLNVEDVIEMRKFLKKRFEEKVGLEPQIGWIGATWIRWTMDELGIPRPKNSVDETMFVILHMAPVRVAEGDWESGPVGKWKTLKGIFPSWVT